MDRSWIRLEDTAEAISAMRIRGAARIGRSASEALAEYASSWEGEDPKELVSDLRRAGRRLHSTRPTAVSLRNAILLTLAGIDGCDSVDAIKEMVVKGSNGFLTSAEEAVGRIALLAKARIPFGSVVITHCNSNAALTAIEAAFTDGRVKGAICTESRPWRQGHVTSRRLAAGGIPTTMVVDSAIGLAVRMADVAVVGADTVTSDGTLYNKIGTSLLALAAKDAGVPFIVCAETFKFSNMADVTVEERSPSEVADPLRPEDLPGVRLYNPVFDYTDRSLIDCIVTEKGVISPDMAPSIIKDMFGDLSDEELNWL
jgi:ribose 1,5-bisphosphate isomerase